MYKLTTKVVKVSKGRHKLNEKYEKIINMKRPVSESRYPMSMHDRAAQFAPYSALSGYEDAVEETARLTDGKIELDEYEKERINSTLLHALSSPIGTKVKVTHFRPDNKKTGGAYVITTDEIGRFDEVKKELVLTSGRSIFIDDILDLQIAEQLVLDKK